MAASFCINVGFELLEKNYRRKTGEIDLIMRDGAYLVFAEVKYRKKSRTGFPEEAVTYGKQQKIIRTAQWYLAEHKLAEDTPCRFDVISILDDMPELIKNAFGGF